MAWYKMDKIWTLIVITVLLRFLCVLAPQTGYIHPDEFFQSVEVVAGGVLDIDTYMPWEYNKTFPLRSVTFPYLLAGLPLTFLKYVTGFTEDAVLTTYSVLILPRLMATVLSLVNDLAVFYMCCILGLDAKFGSLLMSTSYITMTYLTRTFSNSLETVLFSVLLVLLLKSYSYTRSSKPEGKSSNIKQISKQADGDRRCPNFLFFALGVILMCGVFNRPTFLIFAVTPLISWFLFHISLPTENKLTRAISMALWSGLGTLVTFCFFVCIDTFYFNPDFATNLREIFQNGGEGSLSPYLDMFTTHIVITPWNFIQYNMKSENLSEHGLHPHYLHLLVNIPILFGPMTLGILTHFRDFFYGIHKKKIDWLNTVILASTSVPILLLSIFPHQEPRFLIPVLPLFAILSLGYKRKAKFRMSFITAWLSFNMIMIIIFGFLHQGGIIPCLQHIQHRSLTTTHKDSGSGETTLSTKVKNMEDIKKIDKFIFYHTYMPPRYLLISKTANEQIVDLQGADKKILRKTISNLRKRQGSSKVISTDKVGDIYVAVPGTLLDEVKVSFSVRRTVQFPLHLSFEDPPDIFKVFNELNDFIYLSSAVEFYNRLLSSTSLYLLQIKPL